MCRDWYFRVILATLLACIISVSFGCVGDDDDDDNDDYSDSSGFCDPNDFYSEEELACLEERQCNKKKMTCDDSCGDDPAGNEEGVQSCTIEDNHVVPIFNDDEDAVVYCACLDECYAIVWDCYAECGVEPCVDTVDT